MSSLSIDTMEKLVFRGDKRSVLADLTPNTEEFLLVEIILDIQENKWSADLERRIKEFIDRPQTSSEFQTKLKLLRFFEQLRSAQDKAKVLAEFAKENNFYFSFPKPEQVHLARDDLIADSKDAASSELSKQSLAKISFAEYANRLYAEMDLQLLNDLEDAYVAQLDLKKMLNHHNSQCLLSSVFDRVEILSNVNGAKEAFIYLLEKGAEKVSWFKKFTTEQQEELMKDSKVLNNSQYFKEFLKRKLQKLRDEKYQLAEQTDEQRLKELKGLADFLAKVPKKYEGAYSKLLFEMLSLGHKLKKYDEELFLKYLQTPSKTFAGISHNYQSQLRKHIETNFVEQVDVDFSTGTVISQKALFDAYLEQLLKGPADVKRFSNFLETDYLQKLFLTSQLQRGVEVSKADLAVFNECELKEINDRVVLDIRDNPENFQVGQTVALHAKIKNIKELRVSVFEVNTVNFLLDKKEYDFSSIALAGLVPIMQQAQTYAQKSLELHTERFEFKSLDAKPRGVYIIEFVGGGVYAKAIIRVGALNLVSDRISGRKCLILDEKNNVCRGPRTGVFLRNKFFAVNADGVLVIPESVDNVNEKVVVVHNDFACLSQLQTQRNNYTLAANFLFNPEEFASGVQANMVLSPTLQNNGTPASITLLKEPEIDVLITSSAGIEKKTPIPNVEFAENKDFLFSFLVPPKTQSFSITVKGKIASENKLNDDISLSSVTYFSISKK